MKKMRGASISRLEEMPRLADYPRLGAERCPDRPAIVGDVDTLSYRELDEASARFADWLDTRGIGAGARIAYLGRNSELFFPVLFGCMRAGAILVPINWRCAVPEIAFVLEDSQARLLIHDPEFAATAAQSSAALAVAPALLATREEKACLDRIVRSAPYRAAHVSPDPDACILQMYTSGTTGKPKGVMMSQRAITLQRRIECMLPGWEDWTDDETIVSAMPNFHIGGLSWMLIGLMRSLTCVLTADATPANLLALLRRHRATRTFVVPAALAGLVDLMAASEEPAPRLKTIYYGAAPMTAELLRRCIDIFGCRFGQFYGMTEICGSVAFLDPDSHSLDRPQILRSVGCVYPGMSIEIRDAENRPCPTGTAGEIWINSPTRMLGYFNRPDATAEAMRDGWYRSGDGGYFDAEGYLYLTDRIKDMIVSGGENIYPIEVENALRTHPAVREAVVIGVPDAAWGETVAAVVEWREGQTATLDELRAHCRALIAAYKCPKHLRAVEVLPRTATGKLQRSEVRRGFRDNWRTE